MTGPSSYGLTLREPCAEPDCDELVRFTLSDSEQGQWPIRYSGTCASGHKNLLAPQISEQWIVGHDG